MMMSKHPGERTATRGPDVPGPLSFDQPSQADRINTMAADPLTPEELAAAADAVRIVSAGFENLATGIASAFGSMVETVNKTTIAMAETVRKFSEFDHRWRTSTVVDLATTIRTELAFDKMPILADALMDAGCNNEMMIHVCRSESPNAALQAMAIGIILSAGNGR